jgi:hypothetical protein
MAGVQEVALRAAMSSVWRTVDQPPAIARWPRQAPLSRLTGATPTRAAVRRRSRRSSSGSSAIRVRAVIWPLPGTEVSRSWAARQAGEPRTWRSISRSRSASAAPERREGALDAAQGLGAARLTPAGALHADHLDDLAPAGDRRGEDPGLLIAHRPRLGAQLLGAARDQLGGAPVGLGQAADGAREGAALGRVDGPSDCSGFGTRWRTGRRTPSRTRSPQPSADSRSPPPAPRGASLATERYKP